MNDNEKDIEYIQSLKVDKIFLWDKNPRFVIDFSSDFNINYNNDDKLIKELVEFEDNYNDEDDKDNLKIFKELIDNLLDNGFISDNDSIFVKKCDNYEKYEKYIVLEGNRRIAAIKILNYLKEGKSDWEEWFIKKFSREYFNLLNKKLQVFKKIEEIGCSNILTNDSEKIKQKIFKRDQINQKGKKYWFRIIGLTHILKEYELYKQQALDDKNIIPKLSFLFDKSISKIKKDLDSAIWVISCLKAAKIDEKEYLKWKVSALELSRSKIIDPESLKNLNDLLNIKLDKNLSIFKKESNNFKISNPKFDITFEQLSIFLCENLKKRYYTTRGWNEEYIDDLICFLYPNNKTKSFILRLPLKTMQKIFKDKSKFSELKSVTEDEKKDGQQIVNEYDEIQTIDNKLIEKISTLNNIKQSFLKKCKARTTEENNIVIHFCAFIEFLYHEFNNLKIINKSTVENFPFGNFSLIFRNTFVMLTNIIFIYKSTRLQFIEHILNDNLRNIELVDNIKFNDLLEQLDLTTPSEFSSIEKITKSFFYRSNRRNIHGFFTQSQPEKEAKEIINLFAKNYSKLFNNTYNEICNKLNINCKTIENHKFNFILNFLNNDETMDFLCNFIHNDKYIVTTYSPLSSKEYKKMFLQFKKLLTDFSELIFSL